MKFLLIFSFFFTYSAWATNFNYKNFKMSNPNAELSAKFNSIFSENKFHSLVEPKHGIPSLGLNQVYYKNENQFVLVKYGIEGTFPLDEIISTPKGFVIHKKENNLIYMVYFRGLNIEFVRLILNRMEQKVTNIELFKNFVIPSAHADDCGVTGEPVLNQSSSISMISASAAWESLKACATNIGKGAYDSTIGDVESKIDGLMEFISSPIQYLDKVADKIEKFLLKMSQFMKLLVTDPHKAFSLIGSDLGKKWDEVKSFVVNMSKEMKLSFVCSMLGSLGIDAAIDLFTGGAKSGKIILTINNIANKFGMLGKIFSAISNFNKSALDTLKLTSGKLEKFLQDVLNDNYPDADLKYLDDIAGVDGNLGLRTMSCYLR